MRANIRSIFNEFGNNNNMELSAERDANILTTVNGRKYWIEAPSTSQMIVIHTDLSNKFSSHSTLSEMSRWLELNTNIDALKGVWIGFSSETNAVKLCTAALIENLTVGALEFMFNNLRDQVRNIGEAHS
jgi:hypothetical protein